MGLNSNQKTKNNVSNFDYQPSQILKSMTRNFLQSRLNACIELKKTSVLNVKVGLLNITSFKITFNLKY